MSGLERGVILYSFKGWRKAVAFLLCSDQRELLTTFYVWARGSALPSMPGLEGGVPYLLCMGLQKVFFRSGKFALEGGVTIPSISGL